MNFVDLWGWFGAERLRAKQAGDTERIYLFQLYDQGWKIRESDPQAALNFMLEGRTLAERLHEPWLMMFFDYWRCDMYLSYVGDNATGLDLCMRASVEMQMPIYNACPVRARVYITLAAAFLTMDPLGYSERIAETLDYLEKEIPLDKDTWQRIEFLRAALAREQDRLDDCEQLTLSYIARCEDSNFRLVSAYSILCDLNSRRGDPAKGLEYARLGEEASRKADRPGIALIFLAWQALFQREIGNELEAQRFYNLATTNVQWFGMTSGWNYYDALCKYHEVNSDYGSALKLRQQYLEDVVNGGSPGLVASARYEVCRVLDKLSLPVGDEIALAIAAADKLKDPKPLLKKLEALELH